ncbi:MAG: hypothetical protein ACYCVH_15140 [Ignavibacteriaceae bacterium]
MKKLFLLLFLFLCASAYSQQSQFIIGADWLNSTANNWQDVPLSSAYWNLIQSFGLNFGTLDLRESVEGTTGINNQLNNAYNHGIGIELNTYVVGNAVGKPRRWMYQVEGNYDFNYHPISNNYLHDNNAETHWSKINDPNDPNPLNYLRLQTISASSGLAAYGLINQNQIPDGFNYYVKVRIRNRNGVTTHTPVVQISVIGNGHTYSGIIYADQLGNNIWQEENVFSFYKTASGPSAPTTQSASSLINTDPLGITGVPDYTISPAATYTPYDIQIYWYGQVDCDLDYVIVEDPASNDLNNGVYDNTITTDVNYYAGNSGLRYYKVWDEPAPENFLSVRYENRKVQAAFNNNNYPGKNALAFNPGYNNQQYLAQTEMKIHRCDIYPIHLWYTEPGVAGYTKNLQDSLQIQFLPYLSSDILSSNKFKLPYWFTPQAHSWPNGINPPLREPSAYETKAMVNMAVCYGAKGIQYFMFGIPYDQNNNAQGVTLLDNDDPNNPVPRYTDSYGNPKWTTLQALNNYLKTVGSTLMSLTWQNGFSIHLGQPTGTIISNVQSSQLGTADATTYAELGLFKETDQINNANLDFFYVVNRRTLSSDQRDIAITINKSSSIFNNWKITEVGTSNTWTVSNAGTFTTNYQPGEGKLFRLEPVMIAGGNLAYNETIPANSSISVSGNVTVNSGVTLTIGSGSVLTLGNVDTLKVSGILNAQGTSTNPITFTSLGNSKTPGSWGTITFNGSGASSSNLNYANITYGGGVQCLNSANATIQNSYIDTCTNGVYVYNSAPQILTNHIFEPQQNGIYGEASGMYPSVIDNTITKTTQAAVIIRIIKEYGLRIIPQYMLHIMM